MDEENIKQAIAVATHAEIERWKVVHDAETTRRKRGTWISWAIGMLAGLGIGYGSFNRVTSELVAGVKGDVEKGVRSSIDKHQRLTDTFMTSLKGKVEAQVSKRIEDFKTPYKDLLSQMQSEFRTAKETAEKEAKAAAESAKQVAEQAGRDVEQVAEDAQARIATLSAGAVDQQARLKQFRDDFVELSNTSRSYRTDFEKLRDELGKLRLQAEGEGFYEQARELLDFLATNHEGKDALATFAKLKSIVQDIVDGRIVLNQVTTRQLVVQNESGKEQVSIHFDKAGGHVSIRDNKENTRAIIGILGSGGGSVQTHSSSGAVTAQMASGIQGSFLSLKNAKGIVTALLDTDTQQMGGNLKLYTDSGKKSASLAASNEGGYFKSSSEEGDGVAYLGPAKNLKQGLLTLSSQGKSYVVASVNGGKSGQISLYNEKLDSKDFDAPPCTQK